MIFGLFCWSAPNQPTKRIGYMWSPVALHWSHAPKTDRNQQSQMASPNGRQSRHVVLCCATGQEHGGVGASSVRGRQRGCLITVEGGQLGGVGGEEAGGDAAPVAAADDGHPVLACVPVLHLRRPERNADQLAARSSNSNTGTKNKSGNSEKREDRPRATSHSSSEYIQNRGGRTKREFLIRNGEEC